MEISLKWNICRICLKEEPKHFNSSTSHTTMHNIFDKGKKLIQQIYEFSGIIIKPNDSLPEKICYECFTKINSAVLIRKTCIASNTYLQMVLKRAKSASSLFKQEINKCDKLKDEKAVEAENEITNSNEVACKEAILPDSNKHSVPEGKIVPNFIEMEQETQQDVESDNIEFNEIMNQPEDIAEKTSSQIFDDSLMEENLSIKTLKDGKKEYSNKNNEIIISERPVNACLGKINDVNHEENDNDYELSENEDNTSDVNENNSEIYFGKEGQERKQQLMKNQNTEYYSISEEDDEQINESVEEETDEELMLYLEYEVVDNQVQVSSTVDTNDKIEYDEQNSEASNMLSELKRDYEVYHNLDTNSSSSSKTYTNTVSTASRSSAIKSIKVGKNSTSTKEENASIRYSRGKIKRIRTQSNNSSAAQTLIYVCEICGNQYNKRNPLKMHMKVHYQEKDYQCEICSKRFITACNRQAHMRIHTGEKPFQCKYCERRFNDRSSKLRHERTHTNEKPFKCDNCGKAFSLATTLQNHMKVHTNERFFRCEPCGKSFKLIHHLKNHQNTSLHRSVLGIK